MQMGGGEGGSVIVTGSAVILIFKCLRISVISLDLWEEGSAINTVDDTGTINGAVTINGPGTSGTGVGNIVCAYLVVKSWLLYWPVIMSNMV
jgi:hypothetical protein